MCYLGLPFHPFLLKLSLAIQIPEAFEIHQHKEFRFHKDQKKKKKSHFIVSKKDTTQLLHVEVYYG